VERKPAAARASAPPSLLAERINPSEAYIFLLTCNLLDATAETFGLLALALLQQLAPSEEPCQQEGGPAHGLDE
jgi:hypothetical protein